MISETMDQKVDELGKTVPSPKLCTTKGADLVFMTTGEAAAYLRKSASWLLHQRDIAYLPGKPNLYRQRDLDTWAERHTVRPKVRI